MAVRAVGPNLPHLGELYMPYPSMNRQQRHPAGLASQLHRQRTAGASWQAGQRSVTSSLSSKGLEQVVTAGGTELDLVKGWAAQPGPVQEAASLREAARDAEAEAAPQAEQLLCIPEQLTGPPACAPAVLKTDLPQHSHAEVLPMSSTACLLQPSLQRQQQQQLQQPGGLPILCAARCGHPAVLAGCLHASAQRRCSTWSPCAGSGRSRRLRRLSA